MLNSSLKTFFIFLLFSTSLASSSDNTTVYEILPKFGLPPGLLPATVTSYSLAGNGEFEVDLAGECYVDFEYLVYYAPKITGVIRYGEIDNLKGIQVRRFFLWFDVDVIKVDLPPSDYIYFDVGIITKKLSVGQFEEVHSCQKGLMEFGEGLYMRSEDSGMIMTE